MTSTPGGDAGDGRGTGGALCSAPRFRPVRAAPGDRSGAGGGRRSRARSAGRRSCSGRRLAGRPPAWWPRDGAAGRCTPLRRRSGSVCRPRDPLLRRAGFAAQALLRLRRRSPPAARRPVAGARAARRPGRVVAVEPLARQPPHELPQRHVRVDVRQQPTQPLQRPLALGVDHGLHLVAPVAQRAHLVGRHGQLGVHAGQKLLHLPRAPAGRLPDQRLARGHVQQRRGRRRFGHLRWRCQ